MKRMIVVIALSVLANLFLINQVAAQNTLIAANSAKFDNQQADPYTCHVTGSNRVIIWQVKYGDVLAFCVPGLTPQKNYSYSIKVDSNPTISIDPYCINYIELTVSGLCSIILPDAVVTQLSTKIEHTVIITYFEGQVTSSIPYQFKINRPTCNLDGRVFEVGDILPADIPGALRNQQGSITFETLVGKLRRAGFRAEWQRIQFRESNTALDGYWYLLGWCEGK